MSSPSDEDAKAAYDAMMAPAAALHKKHDYLYKQRFPDNASVVNCVGEKEADKWEVWKRGKGEKVAMESDSEGRIDVVDEPTLMDREEILACPLGRASLLLEKDMPARCQNRSEEESEDEASTTHSAKKRGSTARKHRSEAAKGRKKNPRAASVDDFIVSDGEIDPPSKEKRKHGRKSAKRKNEREESREKTESEETDEEQSPKKKKGRKMEVATNPPKRRGRPPKNRPADEASRRKETPSRNKQKKEERKRRTPSKTKGRRGRESGEDEEMQVIEVEEEKREERKKKRRRMEETEESELEEEEEKGPEMMIKKFGRVSKKDGVSRSEEREERSRKRSGRPDGRGKKNKKKESNSSSENEEEEEKEYPTLDSPFVDMEEMEFGGRRGRAMERGKGSRRRKRTEDSEEEQEELGSDEDRSEMPSSSRRTATSKKNDQPAMTAKDLYLKKEKEKKKRKKKAMAKKILEESEARARAKKLAAAEHAEAVKRNRTLRPEDSFDFRVEDQPEYFTARIGNRSPSRSPSRAPSTVGSRAPSRSVSREASPERSPQRSPQRSPEISPERPSGRTMWRSDERSALDADPLGTVDPEALQRKLKLTLLKKEQEKERAMKEERERRQQEQRERDGTARLPPPPPPPLNPNEKMRVKPKVMIRPGRDAGILDSGPPPVMLSKRGGGTGHAARPFMPRRAPAAAAAAAGGGGGATAASSSVNFIDDIFNVMDRAYPSASSIDRSSNGPPPYVQPTRVRQYAPHGPLPTTPLDHSIQYRGSHPMHLPPPTHHSHHSHHSQPTVTRRPSDSRGPSDPRDPRDRAGPSSAAMEPPSPMEMPPLDNDSADDVEVLADSPLPPWPASPDGPASPTPVENQNNYDRTAEEDEAADYAIFHPRHPEGAQETGKEDPATIKRQYNNILMDLTTYLEAGDANSVLWALKRKFEIEEVCHFDRTANREFIFDLLEWHPVPSAQLLAAVSLVARWDAAFCDRSRRLKQCRLERVSQTASLSFATLPVLVEEGGDTVSLKSPLSVAVDNYRLLWAEALIKMGANVNERVTDDSFDGIIIEIAIKNAPKYDGYNGILDLLTLLIAYGANRGRASAYLHNMKKKTLKDYPGLNETGLRLRMPYYDKLRTHLDSACLSVRNAFYRHICQQKQLTENFVMDVVEETEFCSLPYKNFLVVPLREYIEPYLHRPNRELFAVFAVIVGMSPMDVRACNEHGGWQTNLQIGSVKVENDPPAFALHPCARIKQGEEEQEPRMNGVAFSPLEENQGIFILPPQLYPHLQSAVVFFLRDTIPKNRVIYASVVRLLLKGERSKEQLRKTLASLHGARGRQFDGLY